MNDNHYLEKTLMRGWTFLTGDVSFTDYGGSWYRMVGDGLYHVIELTNMVDACGNDADYTYHVRLVEVDVQSQDVDRLLNSFGWQPENLVIDDTMIVEMAVSYGSSIHLWDATANSYRHLLAAAKRDSKDTVADSRLHLQRLQRPVNRLGSTALEMARGDFTSGMVRGIAKQDKTARLIGKIHGATDDDMDAVDPVDADFSLVHPDEYQDIIDRMG